MTSRLADTRRTDGEAHAHEIEALHHAELRELQGRLLAQQLEYLYERSPFYRRKLDDAGRPHLTFRGLEVAS